MLNPEQKKQFEEMVLEQMSKLDKGVTILAPESVDDAMPGEYMDKELWAQKLKELDDELAASTVGIRKGKPMFSEPLPTEATKVEVDPVDPRDQVNQMMKIALTHDQYIGWLLGNAVQFEYLTFETEGVVNPYKRYHQEYVNENSDPRRK